MAALERSATLGTTATGGLLQRARQALPGAGTWVTATASCSGATTISLEGVVFVVSGIFRRFDNFVIHTDGQSPFDNLKIPPLAVKFFF